FDDVIIGADRSSPELERQGEAYIVFGTSDGFAESLNAADLDGTNGVRFKDANEGDWTGYKVSNAGDVNGDGVDDVIVASPWTDREGQAYVVFGSADPFPGSVELADLDGSNGFRVDGAPTSNTFGHSISAAGDFNGDGVDDIVVSAHMAGAEESCSADHAECVAGEVTVIFGSIEPFAASFTPDALDETSGFRLKGTDMFFGLGSSVSDAGDFNGDGFDDLIVSATPYWYHPNKPASYILFGSDQGFPASTTVDLLDPAMVLRIDGIPDGGKHTVSSAGDVNKDGFTDLIVGQSKFVFPDQYESQAFIIYGFDTDPDPSMDFQGTDANETVEGSVGNDSLAGNGGKDNLTGLEGDDTLEGGEGHDTLDGGAGADTILAGAGRRDYMLVTGTDGEGDIRHSGGEGERDTIRNTQSGADFTLSNVNNDVDDDGVADFNIGTGTVSGGIEHIQGNGGKLLGNADTNYFNFADVSLGLKQVDVRQGDDTVIGSGITNKRTYRLGEGNDSFTGTGNRKDVVDGGADNDVIDTGAGKDNLAGGLGEDSLLAGADNDTIEVAGNDALADIRISGGEGIDKIFNLNPGADFALSNINNDTDDDGVADFNAGTGTINGGVEQILGRGGSLLGDAQANHFDVSAVVLKTATVQMLGGDDTVIAASHGKKRSYDLGEGNDSFQGTGTVKDTVLGGTGDDTIAGAAGNDRLDGGAGTNELTGDEGDDIFIFTKTTQSETTVTDFDKAGNDRLDLRDFGYENLAAVKAAAEQIGTDVKIGLDATNSAVLRNTDLDALQNGDFIFA
ncbi:MAG: hypothetical protein AAFW76_07285, partial [Pseudomonadota bacterium]